MEVATRKFRRGHKSDGIVGGAGLALSDRRVAPKVKGRIYRVAVRPALLYGLESLATTKTQEYELETAEMSMLHFSLGVTKLDKIRTEKIRGTVHVGKLEKNEGNKVEIVWSCPENR